MRRRLGEHDRIVSRDLDRKRGQLKQSLFELCSGFLLLVGSQYNRVWFVPESHNRCTLSCCFLQHCLLSCHIHRNWNYNREHISAGDMHRWCDSRSCSTCVLTSVVVQISHLHHDHYHTPDDLPVENTQWHVTKGARFRSWTLRSLPPYQ